MQHYRFNGWAFLVYALTIALAGLFLGTGVKAAFGLVRYQDHYFFELMGLVTLSWGCTGPRELVVLRRIFRSTCNQAAKAYTYIGRFFHIHVRRAARSLAALFTFHPFNNPQTEP